MGCKIRSFTGVNPPRRPNASLEVNRRFKQITTYLEVLRIQGPALVAPIGHHPSGRPLTHPSASVPVPHS